MKSVLLSLESAKGLLELGLNDAICNNRMFDLAKKVHVHPDTVVWQLEGAHPGDIALLSQATGKVIFSQRSGTSFVDEAVSHLTSAGFALNSIEAPLSSIDSLQASMSQLHMSTESQAFSIMSLRPDQVEMPVGYQDARIVEATEFDASGLDLIARFSLERLGVRRSSQECRDLADSASRRFFGLHSDGCIRAIAALTRSVGRARCISFVYTSPQDRRQGLALQLLKGVIARCKDVCDAVFLHVEQGNEPAAALYRSIGWETIAQFVILNIQRRNI